MTARPTTVRRRSVDAARVVWFYREYAGMTGGEVKHADYFEHVRRMPGFASKLTLGGAKLRAGLERERQELWPVAPSDLAPRWAPEADDLLFLAAEDWRYLQEGGLEHLRNPRLNLIQGVRHSYTGSELYGYLNERAIRICVSEEVADAIRATGRTNGPIITIANGIDIGRPSITHARPSRTPPTVTIVDYKRPDLGRALRGALAQAGIPYVALTSFLPRCAFLGLLAASDVAVCLPLEEEGFYLPALEAMASGCVTVTLDCVGNRGFCDDQRNCFIAQPTGESLFATVQEAIEMPAAARETMFQNASKTVQRHSLAAERTRFHALLGDIDNIW